jgi:hypothetical protein
VGVQGGGGWAIVRAGHDGSLGCKTLQKWQSRGMCRCGSGTEFYFCNGVQEGSKIADGSSACLLLKLVLSGPSELAPDFVFLRVQLFLSSELGLFLDSRRV